jgi:hypothetical protein
MYELILNACSSEEKDCWRSQLSNRIVAESQSGPEDRADALDLLSSLTLDVKPYSTALGVPSRVIRRSSVHRAVTLGPKSDMLHVVIRNTEALRDGRSTSSQMVQRSQSLLTTSNVPTLAPRRIDRIRLERSLSNVWTREFLPYPGMATRRPDHPIRASAQSLMRKLSMASLASSFSRRSASHASITQSRSGDDPRVPTPPNFTSASTGSSTPGRQRVRKARPPAEYHNSMAFLPADFDLQGLLKKRRRMSIDGAMGAPVSWAKSATTPSTPTTPYPNVKIPDFGERAGGMKMEEESSTTYDGGTSSKEDVIPPVRGHMSKPRGLYQQQQPSATITKVSSKLKNQLLKLLRD